MPVSPVEIEILVALKRTYASQKGSLRMPIPIDRHEIQALIETGIAQVVEVLPDSEYAEAHLPEAINIPLKELDAGSTSALNKDAP